MSQVDEFIPTVNPSSELLLSHLAPVLVNPVARARLVALTRTLPFFSAGFLEFRLAAAEPQVDFAVSVRDPHLRLPSAWLATPEWQAVQALLRHRQRPDVTGPPDGLEFDLVDMPTPIPRPRLFCSPFRYEPPGFTPDMVLEALSIIEAPIPGRLDRFRAHLNTCLDALPPEGCLRFIGTSPGATPTIRLVLNLPSSEATPSGAVAYLHRVGCTAAAQRLAPVLDRLGPPVSYLNLNLGEDLEARVDIEFGLSEPDVPPGRARALFDRLVELDLATRAKCDALMTWPGGTRLGSKQASPYDRLFAQSTSPMLLRGLSHCLPHGVGQADPFSRRAIAEGSSPGLRSTEAHPDARAAAACSQFLRCP